MNNYPQKKSKLPMILIITGIAVTLIVAIALIMVYFAYNTPHSADAPQIEAPGGEDFKGTVLTFSPLEDKSTTKKDIHPYAEAIRTSLQSQGYTDCIVVENKDKIIVQMPGVFDYPNAEELAKKPELKFEDTNGNVLLNGDSIAVARAEYTNMSDGSKGNIVKLVFTQDGAKLFEEATRKLSEMPPSENIIAICLNDNVISAPAVFSAIAVGECYIEGDFTQHQAKALAAQITAASLNYEIKLEKQEVFSK